MRTLLLLPFALFLTGCDIDEMSIGPREQEDFHFNFPLKANGRLTIDNYNGSVEISVWDQEKIEIHGTKYATSKAQLGEIKIDAQALTADSVAVRTVPPLDRRGNTGARYIIRVPRRVQLERIASSNGSARVEGVEGPARVQTSNGTVRVSQHKGTLDVSTSNGNVEVRDVTGTVTARTTNGRVTVEDLSGPLDASTSNGSINAVVRDTPQNRTMRLTTSNGSIDLSVQGALQSDLRAQTSNGSVTLRMPGSTNARVSASTSNSSISNEFTLSGMVTSTKRRLEGRIGNGGPTVDISTSNGQIRLQRSGV